MDILPRTAWQVLLVRAGLFLGLWLVLTGFEPSGLIFGAVSTIAATALSARLFPKSRRMALWRASPMLPSFLWNALLGGLDVARRSLDPRLPLAPGWRTIPCSLPSGGRFLIGSEFSLMPGTLIAGCRRGDYLVHLLDKNQPIADSIARAERRLSRAMAHDVNGEGLRKSCSEDRSNSKAP